MMTGCAVRGGQEPVFAVVSVKQVRMGTGAECCQNQFSFLDLINQKPVRLNMTFPESSIISGQSMISILGRKRFSASKISTTFSSRVRSYPLFIIFL